MSKNSVKNLDKVDTSGSGGTEEECNSDYDSSEFDDTHTHVSSEEEFFTDDSEDEFEVDSDEAESDIDDMRLNDDSCSDDELQAIEASDSNGSSEDLDDSDDEEEDEKPVRKTAIKTRDGPKPKIVTKPVTKESKDSKLRAQSTFTKESKDSKSTFTKKIDSGSSDPSKFSSRIQEKTEMQEVPQVKKKPIILLEDSTDTSESDSDDDVNISQETDTGSLLSATNTTAEG